jgi:hypothetical protein
MNFDLCSESKGLQSIESSGRFVFKSMERHSEIKKAGFLSVGAGEYVQTNSYP